MTRLVSHMRGTNGKAALRYLGELGTTNNQVCTLLNSAIPKVHVLTPKLLILFEDTFPS